MTFNQVKQCYQNSISINTIYRLIKNQPILYKVDFNTNPKNWKNIYIDIDDTYRNFWFDNKKQKCKEKVLHFYQERKDDKFINEVGLDSKKSMLLTISKIFSILSTYYGDLKQFNTLFVTMVQDTSKQLLTSYMQRMSLIRGICLIKLLLSLT